MLIIRRSKLHYTASGIITPIGGRLVHGLRENCFTISFISCLYMFRAPCAHHQEVKIVLYSIWYHHTVSQPVHETATYSCDDTRGCVMHFWPPDDEHMCSKHVEAWNKNLLWNKFCASNWLNTEINILRCTVSKTSNFFFNVLLTSWYISG